MDFGFGPVSWKETKLCYFVVVVEEALMVVVKSSVVLVSE